MKTILFCQLLADKVKGNIVSSLKLEILLGWLGDLGEFFVIP